jgi:hypothetical protein
MILTGWSRRTLREACPSATLSTTNPTWTDPGAKPGLRLQVLTLSYSRIGTTSEVRTVAMLLLMVGNRKVHKWVASSRIIFLSSFIKICRIVEKLLRTVRQRIAGWTDRVHACLALELVVNETDYKETVLLTYRYTDWIVLYSIHLVSSVWVVMRVSWS